MAKLIGIDIRTRYVRAVLLATNYRKLTLAGVAEVDRTQFSDLASARALCLVSIAPHSDAIAVAIDGDVAFIHRLKLPPTAMKQLTEVIPFELEAQVPVDIDELVYDFIQLPRVWDRARRSTSWPPPFVPITSGSASSSSRAPCRATCSVSRPGRWLLANLATVIWSIRIRAGRRSRMRHRLVSIVQPVVPGIRAYTLHRSVGSAGVGEA